MSSQPISPLDEREVHKVQDYLCKGIRLSQAYLHLWGHYVRAAGDVWRLKLDLEIAEEMAKRLAEEKQQTKGAKGLAEAEKNRAEEEKRRLEEELTSSKATTGKATEELLLTKAALDQANSEFADMQSAQSSSMEAVRTLTQQRSDLVKELAETQGTLEEENSAHFKAAKTVKAVASDCFKMALAQIRHLNPGVQLEIAGYNCRADFKGGVLILPPFPEEESVSLVDEGHEGQVGEETSSAVPPEDGAPEEEATPPS
ncbi:hypothetical protein K1719_016020 [Acacia pycnantha]|nr:hypothetical protein K1719_016020 [Acacia pycnantha]